MKLVVTKAFKFAIGGTQVVRFKQGEADLPQEAADIALKEGWAEKIAVRGNSSTTQPRRRKKGAK